MEIDVGEEREGKPSKIRFSDENCLDECDSRSFYITDNGGDALYFLMDEVPNLIKALKKYQELYGE